ncbi:MAG: sulfatase [Opitutales bacterium]
MKKLTISLLVLSALSLFAKDDRPNIIFFLADDLARNHIGIYGNEQVKTPNLDKLASDGIVFANSYATTSICMASRATMMTGMYEYKNGCNFDKAPLWQSKWQKTYPILLRKAGYYTGFAGKFGFAVREDGSTDEKYKSYDALPADDFDYFAGAPDQTSYITTKTNKAIAKYAKEYPHATRAYGKACSDFIVQAKKTGKPFCLSMSFKAPHTPNTPDPFFNDVYKDVIWKTPANYGKENAKHFVMQARLGKQYLFAAKNFAPNIYQEEIRKYNQLIYGVDYAVGMILDTLKEEGLADNTIIIFTSDNGYSCGTHGFGHKALAYEEASKTPLIILDPRAKKADTSWNQALVANIDIMPTILDYAGLEIPENVDGTSLKAIIEGTQSKVREALPLFQVIESLPSVSMSIVSENFKYIYYPYAEKLDAGEELFNLKTDKFEMHNVIADPENKEILRNMKAEYNKALAHWKNENVKRSSYEEFEIIFDQSIDWQTKKKHIPALFENCAANYKYLLKAMKYNGDIYDYDAIMNFIDENSNTQIKQKKKK